MTTYCLCRFFVARWRAMEAEQLGLPTPPLPARICSAATDAVPRSSSGSSEFLGVSAAEELRGTPRNSEELALALHAPILSAPSSGAHARGACTTRRGIAISSPRERLRITNGT